MLATVAVEVGTQSINGYLCYYNFFCSVLLSILIKIFKCILNIDRENLHAVGNANCVRAIR